MLSDLIRCALIYVHLLFFGVAIALVFWADLRIFRGKMTDSDYVNIGTFMLRLFVGLWITGLTIIYIDTGLDPAIIAERPKVLTKLMCILMLSINAIVLHRVCLGILIDKSALDFPQALTLSICGAVSTSHWLLAAFVGSAEMLGQFSFDILFNIYCVLLGCVILMGIAITPHARRILNRQRSRPALYSVDLHLGDV